MQPSKAAAATTTAAAAFVVALSRSHHSVRISKSGKMMVFGYSLLERDGGSTCL